MSCSWYCHRLFSAGCQHGPVQARGAGGGAAMASPMEQSARASTTRGIDRRGLIIIVHLQPLSVSRPACRSHAVETDVLDEAPLASVALASEMGQRKRISLVEVK